jgi:hypothetical protein
MIRLSDVLWDDAEIKSISVGYGEVRISLVESTGKNRAVLCRGYIGYQMTGFWDEMVVERAEVVGSDQFLQENIGNLQSRYGQELPDTGCPERNGRLWKILRIHLSDGAILKIVAAEFSSE